MLRTYLCLMPECHETVDAGRLLCDEHAHLRLKPRTTITNTINDHASNNTTIKYVNEPESYSTAKKYDLEKVRLELLNPIALNEIAKVFAYGSGKYGENNWRKGFKWSRLLGAALRHLLAFLGGEDKDPETGLSHLAHLGANVMFLLEHEVTHKDKDDRYKAPESSGAKTNEPKEE